MEISPEETLAIKRMIPSFIEMGEEIMTDTEARAVQVGEDYIRIARLLERLLSQ